MTTRRRVLTILAGAGAAAALGGGAPVPGTARWRGTALGARATIALAHPQADRLLAAARAEIERLEAIFSLYRADSALMRLNGAGRLDAPPLELVELIGLARRAHRATGGAFDPTVQPLWRLHAGHAARGTDPTEAEIAEARALTGLGQVSAGPSRIAFARRGMALTLNGIAQGFVADRVARLLAAEGLAGALIETGEIRALGEAPGGRAWRVGLADAGRSIGLADRAVATSAPGGTVLDAAGRVGHILDPRTGRPGGAWRTVSVSAARAATADALSTAFCLMAEDAMAAALAAFPGARIEHLA